MLKALFLVISFALLVQGSDEEVLMELYKSTNGANWKDNTNWGSSMSICTWIGVTCDSNGRVGSLSLSANNLVGQIPESLGELSELTALYLYANQLTGALPQSLANLDLHFVDVNSNQLSGTIPSFQSQSLQYLILYRNKFSGNLPDSIGSIGTLERLILSENQFTGSIPDSYGSLGNLMYMFLDSNQLSGSIPDLSGLSSVESIKLNDNQLSGSIPESVGSLSRLLELIMQNNQLSGSVPESLGYLDGQLSWLDLSNNKLNEIPDMDLTVSSHCNLSANPFKCPIPSWASSICQATCN